MAKPLQEISSGETTLGPKRCVLSLRDESQKLQEYRISISAHLRGRITHACGLRRAFDAEKSLRGIRDWRIHS